MAEIKIGGREYRTAPLPAKEAVALYIDLNRIAGKAKDHLPGLFLQSMSENDPDALMSKALTEQLLIFISLTEVLEKTSTPEIIGLLDRIVRVAEIKRPSGAYDPCDFDGDFSGQHLKDLFPIVRWVVSEQFRDFFTESADGGLLGMVQAVFPSNALKK